MGTNPEWYAQQRARGLCWICRRPMRDDDPRYAHGSCAREQHTGRRVADIRAQQPLPLGPQEARKEEERQRW